MFAQWKQIHKDTLKTFAMFSDQELAYQPFPGSWSAGQTMLHIPDTEEYWLRVVVAGEPDFGPERFSLSNYPTIAAIQSAFEEVHQKTEAFLKTLDGSDLRRMVPLRRGRQRSLDWIIWHVLEHEVHHRGELSLMLGLLGRNGLDV
jgi:uncharacterized damage-inducible protein DinB